MLGTVQWFIEPVLVRLLHTTRLLGYGLFSKNCVLRTVEEEHNVVSSQRRYECLIAEIALEGIVRTFALFN